MSTADTPEAPAAGEHLPEAAEPPSIADGLDHELDPRVIPLQRTVGWIVAGVVAAGSLVVLSIVWRANGLPGWAFFPVWTLANGALVWHTQRWPVLLHRHARYRVDEQGIEIRQGVYWRTVVNVPRARVQHTDVSQGPIERRYGLGTLVTHTAGTDHARVSLSGLDHAIALRIRAHLLPREEPDAI